MGEGVGGRGSSRCRGSWVVVWETESRIGETGLGVQIQVIIRV